MEIAYIAKANIPSTAANSVHVMKICESFAEICDDFCLIIPQNQENIANMEKCYDIYGVTPFRVETVKTALSGIVSCYVFAAKSVWKARKASKIITRDPLAALFAVILGKQTVLDLHGDLSHLCGRAYRMIKWKWFRDNKLLCLTVTTKGLKNFYTEKYGVTAERMLLLPNGYSDNSFLKVERKEILKNETMNIGYCGGFVSGKGLKLIHQLAAKDNTYHYNLFGGTREDAEIEMKSAFSENVFFGGYVPSMKVPEILNEQDILLLPNQEQQICKNEDIGKITSPIKMFEYMMSGRVIVASDITVLREILTDDNSFLVSPDDPEKWLETIRYIDGHREEARLKANRAHVDVKKYTWKNRAKKLLELCQ